MTAMPRCDGATNYFTGIRRSVLVHLFRSLVSFRRMAMGCGWTAHEPFSSAREQRHGRLCHDAQCSAALWCASFGMERILNT